MTRDQLDAIRARVEAATPGPWHVEGESYDECWDEDCEPVPMPWGLAGPTGKSLWSSGAGEYAHPDMATAEFIASAREDVPALLAEVERLTADPLPAAAWVREVERAAFQRGVAAMREAAAMRCEISPIHSEKTTTARKYADAVRALPDPEDK